MMGYVAGVIRAWYGRIRQQEEGVSSIEYGVLAALIAVAGIAAVSTTGANVSTMYCTIANGVSASNECGATSSSTAGVSKEFLTEAQGGTFNPTQGAVMWHMEMAPLTSGVLAAINSKDPIVGVYGLLDDPNWSGTIEQVSDYAAVQSLFGSTPVPTWGTANDLGTDPGGNPMMQVKTASGAVYTLNGINQGGQMANGDNTADSNAFYMTVTNAAGNVVQTSSIQGYGDHVATIGAFAP